MSNPFSGHLILLKLLPIYSTLGCWQSCLQASSLINIQLGWKVVCQIERICMSHELWSRRLSLMLPSLSLSTKREKKFLPSVIYSTSSALFLSSFPVPSFFFARKKKRSKKIFSANIYIAWIMRKVPFCPYCKVKKSFSKKKNKTKF